MREKKAKPHKVKTFGKSYRKNIFREVRSSLSRFIAIFAITALGAGFFAGLRATSPDMRATADQYYREENLMDYRLLSTMGFTNEDIEELKALPKVDEVMATNGMDMLVEVGDTLEVARLHALPEDTSPGNPEYMNRLTLTAGRMPAAPSECVADSEILGEAAYKMGDVITLSSDNDPDSLDLFAGREFTVVGLARSPYYISFQRGNTTIGSGRISFYLYVSPDAYDNEYYTEVYVTANGAQNLSSFSQQYEDLIDQGADSLEQVGTARAQVRYDEIYGEADEELTSAREELADARAEADEKLAEALQEIEDGEAEIAKGWREVRSNTQKLADARQAIADGEASLAAGQSEITARQVEYETGLAQYNTQKAAYDAQKAQADALEQGTGTVGGFLAHMDALQNTADPAEMAAFDAAADAVLQTVEGVAALLNVAQNPAAAALEGIAAAARSAPDRPSVYLALSALGADISPGYTSLQMMADTVAGAQEKLAAALPPLTEAQQKLAEGKAVLDAGWAQLAAAQVQLDEARAQVADGQKQLDEAKVKLADAQKELAEGKAEYEKQKAEAQEEFAKAETEIADAQKELDDLEKPEWVVLDRDGNPGYSGFASDTGRIDAIAVVIPVFFFLVAALVCLTTMTRMVEEQRTQIGTMKALGFGKLPISLQYILYAGIASLAGAAAGVLIGAVVFPMAIWNAYSILYVMPPISLAGNVGLIVLSIAVSVLCTTLATLAACYNELRSVPARLMRPKAPKAGKRVLLERIKPLWRHMTFTQKVTVRNLFRYKRRFFMTVIGVAGCTALLLTGFGLRDSITGIVPRQFGGINLYDMTAALSDPATAQQDTPLNDWLAENGQGMYVQQTVVDVKAGTENNAGMTTYLFVGEDPEKLNEYIDFHDRESEEKIAFPQGDGVLITEKLATRLGLKPGDSFRFGRPNEPMGETTVAGVVENYVYNYIYITPESYEARFGEAPQYETLLINLSDTAKEDTDGALKTLVATKGVTGAMDISAMSGEFDDMFASLDSVIWLIIIAAAMLAIVVLYNLTNINITERSREIATLKVLGFYNGEVASYVYRENIVLTLIGIAAGLVGGIFLHKFVIQTAEVDEVMFRRVVEPLSYVLSAVFTLACAGLVNLIMLGRLKKIDMVESLKSAE